MPRLETDWGVAVATTPNRATMTALVVASFFMVGLVRSDTVSRSNRRASRGAVP